MKNKIKKFINSKYAIFFLLYILMFGITILKSVKYLDDLFFADYINNTGKSNIFEFLIYRYETWTSRVIIEFFLALFASKGVILWRILDPLMYTILAYGIYKVFFNDTKENKILVSITACMVIMIPQSIFNTAGWMATSLNYLWPTALGIFSLIPIRNYLDGDKLKWYDYILYTISLVFASNAEQMCAVLVVVYLIFSIYFIIKKDFKPYLLVGNIITIFSIIFIATANGNQSRTMSDIMMFYPNYNMLNIIDKLVISIIISMKYYIFSFNYIYIIFTLLLTIKIWRKYNNIFYRFIPVYLVLFGTCFNIFSNITQMIFPDLYNAFQQINILTLYIDLSNFNSITTYIPLFLTIINLGFLVISILLSFGISKKSIIGIITICAGICSKLMLGFVGITVFLTDTRTQLIFMCTMICLSLMIIEQEKFDKKILNIIFISTMICIFNYICLCWNTGRI